MGIIFTLNCSFTLWPTSFQGKLKEELKGISRDIFSLLVEGRDQKKGVKEKARELLVSNWADLDKWSINGYIICLGYQEVLSMK